MVISILSSIDCTIFILLDDLDYDSSGFSPDYDSEDNDNGKNDVLFSVCAPASLLFTVLDEDNAFDLGNFYRCQL